MQSEHTNERRKLSIVLLLNGLLAAAFLVVGGLADSSALIANGVDNLSDAAVYAVSIVALTRGSQLKSLAAFISGMMLLAFAGGVFLDIVRRYLEGSEPTGTTMMLMAAVAAPVNYYCLRVLQGIESKDVNLRAATTFSFNDMAANIGILIAGVLVLLLTKNWPDLIAALVTAAIAAKGGIEILRDAWRSRRL